MGGRIADDFVAIPALLMVRPGAGQSGQGVWAPANPRQRRLG